MLVQQTLDKLEGMGLSGMAQAMRQQMEQSQYLELSFEELPIPVKSASRSGRNRTPNPDEAGRSERSDATTAIDLSAGLQAVLGVVVGEAYSAAVAVVMWAGRRAVQVLWSGPVPRTWPGDWTCTGLSTGRHLHSLP